MMPGPRITVTSRFGKKIKSPSKGCWCRECPNARTSGAPRASTQASCQLRRGRLGAAEASETEPGLGAQVRQWVLTEVGSHLPLLGISEKSEARGRARPPPEGDCVTQKGPAPRVTQAEGGPR